MHRLRNIMSMLTWFAPLIFILLMMTWTTVQTQVQVKRLSDIQDYLGDQEKAIDSLKASLDQGEAATKTSITRAGVFFAGCSAPPTAYQPMRDDRSPRENRPHLSSAKKQLIDERLSAAQDELRKLTGQ